MGANAGIQIPAFKASFQKKCETLIFVISERWRSDIGSIRILVGCETGP
jgi:hypothetical protein